MNIQRIWAVLRRHLMVTFRSAHRLIDLFYWTTFDFSVWAITSRWMQMNAADQGNINYQAMIMTAIILWHVLFRTYLEIAFSLLNEIWNRNVVNICTTPLTIGEWSVAVMLLGLIKLGVTFPFGVAIIWIFAGTNIFNIGFSLIPFIGLLAMSGWFIGFVTAGILIRWGKNVETFTWSIGWLFAPLCAAFAPLAVLPPWLAVIAKMLPMTYIFEALRMQISVGSYPLIFIVKSFVLNCIYIVLAWIFFVAMFAKSRAQGLGRLE